MYGAQLMEALRRQLAAPIGTSWESSPATKQADGIEFFGAGGERMRGAGCEIVVDARELAVVGITEILSRLPKILELYRTLIRAVDTKRPEIAVVIDAPAFNWRVARQMRKRGRTGCVLRVPAILGLAAGTCETATKVCRQGSCDFSFRREVLSRSRSGRDICRPSAGGPARAGHPSERLCG